MMESSSTSAIISGIPFPLVDSYPGVRTRERNRPRSLTCTSTPSRPEVIRTSRGSVVPECTTALAAASDTASTRTPTASSDRPAAGTRSRTNSRISTSEEVRAGKARRAERPPLLVLVDDGDILELRDGDEVEDPLHQRPGRHQDQAAPPVQALRRPDQHLDPGGVHERQPSQVQGEVAPNLDLGLDGLGDGTHVRGVELPDQAKPSRVVGLLDLKE